MTNMDKNISIKTTIIKTKQTMLVACPRCSKDPPEVLSRQLEVEERDYGSGPHLVVGWTWVEFYGCED